VAFGSAAVAFALLVAEGVAAEGDGVAPQELAIAEERHLAGRFEDMDGVGKCWLLRGRGGEGHGEDGEGEAHGVALKAV
jgi:hypothetical protein